MSSETENTNMTIVQDGEVPIQILNTEVNPSEQEENNGISYIISFD
ncbi:hypothetical protein [Pseudobutyrivibrio xylanivorans]|nr:hypothetical protein [Pseudobutyrivibrio xylanivorans]